MSNWDKIVGHRWAVDMLASGLANGRLGHAYLITGPDQVGKTTLARTFAQALNCVEPEAERPCGNCRPCKLIAADRHPDVKLIEPTVSGRGKLTLKIETIRQLQKDLNLSAYEARYKVAIMRRFDAATIGAANAFLKTLEEPPGKVILLLTATDADMLLPTISSRCRTLNLRPLPPDLIEQSLATRWQVPQEKATLLAHLADGRLGWAVDAAADDTILDVRAEQLAYLHEALAGQRVQRFQLADKLARKPEQLPHLLKTWLSWWRDLTLLSQRQGQSVTLNLTNVDEISQMEPLAAAWTASQITASLQQTNDALWQLERNANTRLVLENLLLIYPIGD
ncbi:DNA polymerase III delta prime subunit [hydrothermal vent metagenome]|uniref:DNA polymerase III delta prime subunit n=1 Tax=hydrothermal vent metagenome TaxID=652676 RepID=A0A3B0VC93_9ZZZZ